MNNLNGVVPANTGAVQPLPAFLPQQQRLRWEQQWLHENGKVSGVVVQDDSAARDDAAHTSRADAAAMKTQVLASAPLHQVISRAQFAQQENTAAAGGATQVLPTAQHYFEQVGAIAMPIAQRVDIDFAAPETVVNAALTEADYRRHELRQSAFWRDGKNIGVTMRLPESDSNDATVFHVLRRWLKEAGLNLVALVVNGQSRWQSRSRERDGY